MPRLSVPTLLLSSLMITAVAADAQTLNMKEAISTAVKNYGTIKAKADYVEASKQGVIQSKRDYLPNFSLSAQQDYGTVNGQNGPLAALNGLNVASQGQH